MLDKHVLHRAHSNLDQVGVRCVRKVTVDLFRRISTLCAEDVEKILASGIVIVLRPAVVESIIGNGATRELIHKQIHLI